MKPHETGTDNPIDFPKQMNNERSLAEEITAGFEALKRVRELEADNAELKAYNTTLHGIEHDLEMKVSKLQADIAELKNARDYWCLQYKDVINKLEAQCNGFCGEYECKENQSQCKRKAQQK